jgi:hypothetical protein
MESNLHVESPGPETGVPERSTMEALAGKSKPQVVDWFALTEGNVQAKPGEPAAGATPSQTVPLEVPSAAAIGGLRP